MPGGKQATTSCEEFVRKIDSLSTTLRADYPFVFLTSLAGPEKIRRFLSLKKRLCLWRDARSR